jgi:hypothetical protein
VGFRVSAYGEVDGAIPWDVSTPVQLKLGNRFHWHFIENLLYIHFQSNLKIENPFRGEIAIAPKKIFFYDPNNTIKLLRI